MAENWHILRKARKAERKTREVVPPWDVTEVQKSVEVMRVDRLSAPLLLSLMGLIPAEVRGMRWELIDLESETF
ncbi:hypothetical protein [Streptomyces sindenensis]|uniref:hypothetical protein n=1 Tax=Streptomyces sindenensis TaxID=67363 RepID=UPI001678866B|nr:hypothetical protein [Streptomyces sindenensis]GGP83457.1 hypothetical protein GCM10010231_62720 [Streptomyces sindenensis]